MLCDMLLGLAAHLQGDIWNNECPCLLQIIKGELTRRLVKMGTNISLAAEGKGSSLSSLTKPSFTPGLEKRHPRGQAPLSDCLSDVF